MIHKAGRNWDYDNTSHNGWFGERFAVPNQSTGYHGILKQWWDFYKGENSSWLLMSEKNIVKPFFSTVYPSDTFSTLEYYADEQDVDYRFSLCDRNLAYHLPKFDVVLCQATLEHIYDPFTAMFNMAGLLNKNGVVLIHTHTPGFFYHPYPRDYLRYHPDWFIDLPEFIPNIELLELFDGNGHIFSAYRKVK
jgi:SAM-dependent methyltransferase